MNNTTNKSNFILPIIVISQFACTSLWFAGNAVMQNLVAEFHLPEGSLGHLTSAVQFGFILGTLSSALLTLADRFSPSRIFFISALAGSLSNLCLLFGQQSLTTLLFYRFATGFFLAGIYPVGMKIASDYNEKGLGKALGFLVGALVFGTAFPHLLKSITQELPWKDVIISVSAFCFFGGLIILLFVPNGPYRTKSQRPDFKAFFKVFRNRDFRAAAFGYFGHMWELYTFWAFVPVILLSYTKIFPDVNINISALSFIIIGAGGLSCILGGYVSQSKGSKRTAFTALFISCICCLISPLLFKSTLILFLIFLILWGMAVAADSPQFSTLIAHYAPDEFKGTALTIVNCIGFSITIVSIQIFNILINYINLNYVYMILALGPVLGLIAMYERKV